MCRGPPEGPLPGDNLPNVTEGSSGAPFVEFFQRNKVTGGVKGIVAINLEELV